MVKAVRRLVATVLTVYGIETEYLPEESETHKLQQFLPFTVLKRQYEVRSDVEFAPVATVLTVYGIETH